VRSSSKPLLIGLLLVCKVMHRRLRTGSHPGCNDSSLNDLATATSAIQRDWHVYRWLLLRARWWSLCRRYDRAAQWAAAAAMWAMHNMTGEFRSFRLERLVDHLGSQLPAPAGLGKRTDVLHVLTRAAAIGGHTSWICRWIQLDNDRRHSVVLTEQSAAPLRLASVALASGGDVLGLEPRTPILERASAVRAAAARAGIVVLAQNPHDIVPALALAYPRRAPVAICNHGDHVPSVGLNIANVVIEQREAGAQLSRDRRGVCQDRQVMMPLPLPSRTESNLARGAARA
jgi:hypothetical protein